MEMKLAQWIKTWSSMAELRAILSKFWGNRFRFVFSQFGTKRVKTILSRQSSTARCLVLVADPPI